MSSDNDSEIILQRILSLGNTIKARAARLGHTVRYQRTIEHGHIPDAILRFYRAGVFHLAPDTELAHETNDDTKGADDDSHTC